MSLLYYQASSVFVYYVYIDDRFHILSCASLRCAAGAVLCDHTVGEPSYILSPRHRLYRARGSFKAFQVLTLFY